MILRRGFTLTEMIMVLGIISILLTFSGMAFLNVQYKATLSSVTTATITDIKIQQSKSMQGNTEGTGTAGSYGIYFAADHYVLFHGSSYSASDPQNFSLSLEPPMQFSDILFPGSQIVFSAGSGEISGFTNGQNSVTLGNPENSSFSVIRLNRYGVLIP